MNVSKPAAEPGTARGEVVWLHPEELIDKHARGTLDAAERACLDDHLARCPPCRFEMALRAELAEELPV